MTTPRILFIAAETEAFSISNRTVVYELSTAGRFTSPARCSVRVGQGETMDTAPFLEGHVATDQVWLTFDIWADGFINAVSYTSTCYMYTSGAMPFFRLVHSGAGAGYAQPQYSTNGTDWTSWGNPFHLTSGLLYTINVNVTINSAAGAMEVWVGDTLVSEASGVDLSAVTDMASWRWIGTSYNPLDADCLSKFAITESIDTRNIVITPVVPTGNGTFTAASGDYQDVDDLVDDDTNNITFAADGDQESFTHAATSLPARHQVFGMVVSSRVRKGASGIANFQHILVESGTPYPSASVAALDTSYQPRQSLWETDPATSAAFLAVPNEFGGKGKT